MKLQITLKVNGGNDFVGPISTTTDWNVDLEDCSVHVWFKVAESVLSAAGFNETSIKRGACKLAFGDCRDKKLIKEIFEYCYLNDWSIVNE